MSGPGHFQVEEVAANGLLVGRNAYTEIPVGAVFTSLRKSKVVGTGSSIESVDLGEVALVELRLDRVEWFRQSINAVPRGHSAVLHLSGHGLEALASALAGREEREYLSLHLPTS